MSIPNQEFYRLYDYFVVCGLDFTSGLEPNYQSSDVGSSPLERSYKSRVLDHFPHSLPYNPIDENAVSMFCLPKGLYFCTQKHLLDPSFHSFIVTKEDGSRYYGFSLVFFEEVKNKKISNAIQDLQAMHLTELSSAGKSPVHNSRSLPRHFKLTAHHPRAALNYFDSTKDTLYVSKSIGLISQSQYVVVAEAFLRNLHKYAMTKPSSSEQLSVESYVFNLLYQVPIPRPGRSMVVHLPNSSKIIVQRPITIEELPLLDYPLEMLFSLLTVDHIIQLYTCILLENQVIIMSTDCQKLMLVAECMTSLLFPFTWQHVYVPILPSTLQHFLEAPVPFIMGLPTNELHNPVPSEAELCFLNIDSGKMQIPEERPNFPRKKEFCQKIEEILDKFDVTRGRSHPNDDVMSVSITGSVFYAEPQKRKHSWSHNAEVVQGHSAFQFHLEDQEPVSPENVLDNILPESAPLDPIESYQNLLIFNNAIRETFLHNFAMIFADYHKFIISSKDENRDEWFKNRETMTNFDKATFLSDQPEQDLPFLSQFLESQMFASLIDSKIMARNHETDHNLRVFDKRIKNLSRRHSAESDMDVCQVAIKESQRLIEKRFSDVNDMIPITREILSSPSEHFRIKRIPKAFPPLDASVLSKEPSRRGRNASNSGQWTNHRHRRAQREGIGDRSSQYNKAAISHSPARIAQANWSFVETLLKDCKSKTNRMLLIKMKAEGVQLGEQLGHVEENTLIATFCDHVEKVWSHGMQTKQSKSALWSHLVRFKQDNAEALSHNLDPALSIPLETLSVSQGFEISGQGAEYSPCNTWDSRSLGKKTGMYQCMKPLPTSVSVDVRNIESMSEVKSEIGFSRAWIRLSLEKKLLSRHLHSLLADTALLKAQYKRNAFLRCEEEREQFLFHLLSLNAVDYYCFTNTYISTKLPYRVMIVPVKKTQLSSTTANAWIAVSGTHCQTDQISVPKGSVDFIFHHVNLGLLTTLRIGHDNSGIAPNWFVDAVMVRCEVTGHSYRFPCGRYLGRRLEDGGSERLLVGEQIKKPKVVSGDSGGMTGGLSAAPASPSLSRRVPQRSVAEIQHMIGDAVNNVVKLFYRSGSSRSRGALTPLLCGEMGLVESLQFAFLYGFKASRFFGRNLYLWDYFLRVKESCLTSNCPDFGSLGRSKNGMNNNNNNSNNKNERISTAVHRSQSIEGRQRRNSNSDGYIPRANRTDPRRTNYNSLSRGMGGSVTRSRSNATSHDEAVMVRYCDLVDKIENSTRCYGKDGKFQQFVCLSLREHMLHCFIHPLYTSRPTIEMYEEHSFLRDSSLRSFLIDILDSLSEFDFTLEASITSGID